MKCAANLQEPEWSLELGDTAYWQKNIPCQDACPVHTDARGYVRAIAAGDYVKAYLIARGPNPLASLCGRVCGAHCETNCRRGKIDRPISIRALKRFALEQAHYPCSGRNDFARLSGKRECDGVDEIRHLLARLRDLEYKHPMGERVAIIGSGPAGLSCAHDLCLLGLRPVIFEMEDKPAGMLHYGVPEYRLPRNVIVDEVGLIEALGTEIRCQTEVGKDIAMAALISEFKAVVIAVGARKSRQLPIPGVQGPGVMGGVEFLREVAYDNPPAMGRNVLVIGGGNVAYDAARSSVRQSAMDASRTAARMPVENVYLTCLESRAEMPADDQEVHEGEEEGVIRKNGWGPLRVLRDDDGKVTGVEFQKCLRVFDQDGRFSPEFDPEQKMVIECDTVIITIGQAMDTAFLDPEENQITISQRGWIEVDREELTTSREGVFVAGDAALGLGLMIDAIACGKQAARKVHRFLTGEDAHPSKTDFHEHLKQYSQYSREPGFEAISRVPIPVSPAAQRKQSQKTLVEYGYNEEQARREASRCLDCGVNTIFDSTRCILCGGCVDVCPTLCLKIVPASAAIAGDELTAIARDAAGDAWQEGKLIIKDEDRCIRCANCADRCPVDAISMERFTFEESVC